MLFSHGILILALCCYSSSAASSGWSYEGDHGPDHWADDHSTCTGNFQSPIDFVLNDAVLDSTLGKIKFSGYDASSHSADLTISNNGHTVQVTPGSKTAHMSGGGLPDTYYLQQLHFHWGGVNGDPGSEHTVDGNQHPAEVHFVHFKDAYLNDDGSLNATLSNGQNDVAAVIGVFLEIGDTKNEDFQIILDALMGIADPNSEAALATLDVSHFMPSNTDNFLRYQGGLTTPGCSEIVIWSVMNSTIKITDSQFKALAGGVYHTTLGSNNKADVILQNNYRPVQQLKGRKVKSTWDASTPVPDATTPATATRGTYSYLMMALVMVVFSLSN